MIAEKSAAGGRILFNGTKALLVNEVEKVATSVLSVNNRISLTEGCMMKFVLMKSWSGAGDLGFPVYPCTMYSTLLSMVLFKSTARAGTNLDDTRCTPE